MAAAALSEIGGGMLSCRNYDSAAASAAEVLSNAIRVSHAMVLRLQPAGDAMSVEGGVGWGPEVTDCTIFGASRDTLAGFALESDQPVIIENLRTESRFAIPLQLLDYGLVSGICIRIPCDYQSAGVLAAFAIEPRVFGQNEVSCLRAVAGMLAFSSGCQRAGEDQRKIAQAKQEWEATVDALPQFICLLDERRRIVRANRSSEYWLNGAVSDVRGYGVHELLHPGCNDVSCYMLVLYGGAWNEVANGRHVEYKVEDKVLKRHLGIQLWPTNRCPVSGIKQSSQAVLVLEDITKLKHAEEVLKRSNDQLEHLIQAHTIELVQANQQLKREITERRRVEAELRRSENEMRLLSAQLLTAQEMERKRIASELHDGIGQSLTAIKYDVENAVGIRAVQPGSNDVKLIKRTIPMIQTAIEEVRRIFMNLRPSTLDDLGIVPTIAWFCREFSSIYSDIRLDTCIDVAEEDMSATLKTAIYRIMQEALNNIVKHAKAKHVHVHLWKDDSAIELMVRDDGEGFVIDSLVQGNVDNKRFGIIGMRERAEFSGGTFSIVSNHETGTVVRTAWPHC